MTAPIPSNRLTKTVRFVLENSDNPSKNVVTLTEVPVNATDGEIEILWLRWVADQQFLGYWEAT